MRSKGLNCLRDGHAAREQQPKASDLNFVKHRGSRQISGRISPKFLAVSRLLHLGIPVAGSDRSPQLLQGRRFSKRFFIGP